MYMNIFAMSKHLFQTPAWLMKASIFYSEVKPDIFVNFCLPD